MSITARVYRRCAKPFTAVGRGSWLVVSLRYHQGPGMTVVAMTLRTDEELDAALEALSTQ